MNLDHEKKSERDLSVDLHKGWIDCAAQLGCSAIRVNCRKGGDPKDNLKRAVDGVGGYANMRRTHQSKWLLNRTDEIPRIQTGYSR